MKIHAYQKFKYNGKRQLCEYFILIIVNEFIIYDNVDIGEYKWEEE